MFKMLLPYHFCLLWFAMHVTGQGSVELLPFHDSTQVSEQAFSQDTAPLAATVPNHHLKGVSSSILMAENWTRSHVLAHYPSIHITSIVVGHSLLCEQGQEDKLGLILPSVRNIYYTLFRWGLHKEIKVSASFSSSCMDPNSGTYRDDLADTHIKPLLSFLQDINSPYFVNPPSHLLTHVSDETRSLLNSHSKAMESLGLFNLSKINVIIKSPKDVRFPGRKLSFIGPFPARPTPVAPANVPTGSSAPTHVAKSPLPPLIGKISPPPLSLPFAPEMPPMINPANPPYGFHLPPCAPPNGGAGGAVAGPVGAPRRGLWCVAKPSVPQETLQVAMDFACGEGGADCEAIRPRGSCYYPNTVLAHASYAFNSYWQKAKKKGGTCGFAGTAMLINSDPSYRHCRFSLA